MALGKSGIQMDIDNLSIKFGDLFIIQGGKIKLIMLKI